MTEELQSSSIEPRIVRDVSSIYMPGEPECSMRKWYFSKEEIEDHSPSRKDGIDCATEAYLRKLYCTYIKELGMALKVPQLTIATATLFCHRFFMVQSHAKNDWQTIATVCMFLACKAEETPRTLKEVVVVAYEMSYKWDPSAQRRIRQKEVYDKQKQLVASGEKLLLTAISFELNVQHPYKPLVAALKKLKLSQSNVVKVAWNFVNDWLCTTLCLQYKPHYIAAGSLFLAAKFHKVKLPTEKGKIWWLEFDVSPKQLEEVIKQMLKLLEDNPKQPKASAAARTKDSATSVKKVVIYSPQSCVVNGSTASQDSGNGITVETKGPRNSVLSKGGHDIICDESHSAAEVLQYQPSDCGSASRAVEDADGGVRSCARESVKRKHNDLIHGCYSELDLDGSFRAKKAQRHEAVAAIQGDELPSEAYSGRELENGIKLGLTCSKRNWRCEV